MSKRRRKKNYKTWGYFFNIYKEDPYIHFDFFVTLCKKAIEASKTEDCSCYREFQRIVKEVTDLKIVCYPARGALYGLLETGQVIYGSYEPKDWDKCQAVELTQQLSKFLKKRYVQEN